MISYKLAKLLKEAGFPQEPNEDGAFQFYHDEIGRDGEMLQYKATICGIELSDLEKTRKDTREKDRYKIPTLSELIDACGERFSMLCHYPTGMEENKKWMARAEYKDEETTFTAVLYGKTKEEAVAKLWLKLNKK